MNPYVNMVKILRFFLVIQSLYLMRFWSFFVSKRLPFNAVPLEKTINNELCETAAFVVTLETTYSLEAGLPVIFSVILV